MDDNKIEKWPEDRIVELNDELDNLRARVAFYEANEASRTSGRPMIYAAMITAMREVSAVGKDGRNLQQNYQFRGIDGVLNAVGPALRKAGVFVTSEVAQAEYRDTLTTGDKKTREFTTRVRYTFHAEDGSSITTEVPGESLDQSDKGTAKGMSVAFRIALIQTFALPTDEPTTDHDGQYKVRGGTPTLSGWTASYGRAMIDHGNPDEVIDFWPAVVESSSIEAPCGHASGETWGESIAKRIAEFVAEEQSPDTLRELYGKLRAADMLSLNDGATPLGQLVVERGKTVVANRAKAFDHCMQLITSAANLDALDTALAHVMADRTDGPLTHEQASELAAVAGERRKRLETELNQAAPQFLPATGAAYGELVNMLDAERLSYEDLLTILSGAAGNTPPCLFGPDGVQRFIDAVKRSQSGYQSIDASERAELFASLKQAMHEADIVWSSDIQ